MPTPVTPEPAIDLVQLFASRLEDREAPIEAALAIGAADLLSAKERVRDLYADLLSTDLADEQRAAIGGRRFPDLQEIGTLLGVALGNNPEIVRETGVTPAHLAAKVQLDSAAGRSVYAAQLLRQGGENGVLIASATLEALCDRVVLRAQELCLDGQTPVADRGDIAAAFAEASRLLSERGERRQAAFAKEEKAERPQREKIDRAEEHSATTRLLDAFLSTVGRPAPKP